MDSRIKCLLVDDRRDTLLGLAALLERDDVEILTARSGASALELLLGHDVALVLLDVQMPEMDGFELAELMRGSERTRDIPLIFVTGGTRESHRLFKGYDLGAVDFLYKPIEPHILKSKAGVFFQLHRQKQQLAQELRSRTEALRLNEMFAAVLGHDLRAPLGAILTGTRLLEQQSDDGELVRRTAARMRSSGEHMSRMIEDMLDFARARLAGGIPVRIEQLDLESVVRHVVQEQQATHPHRQIDTQFEGDLIGEGDPERLAQAASNLLGNALQHGEQQAPVRVQVDGSQPECLMLSVTNAGGIAADVLPHLFEAFHRGQRYAGRSNGLGLGLYIMQQIVQAHQGTVEVQSDDERQTVIRLTMPRTQRVSGRRERSETTRRDDESAA
jgi:two-component system sensor histidine kinase/response regulator